MKLRPNCLRYPASTAALMAAIFASFAGQSAHAQTGTWTSLADGDWSTATNWSGNVIADGAGSQANFNMSGLSGGTNTTTTTLDGNRTIGNLSRGAGTSGGIQQSWTITHATNVLTLDNGASNVFISSGLNGNYTLTVDTDIALNSNLVLVGNGNNNAKVTLGATVGGHTITGNKNITFNNTSGTGAGALIINSNINTTGGIFNTSSGGSNFLAINGNIGSGVTGVTQSGSRTLTLSGNNTYTGPTTISAGTLAMVTNRIASSSNILIGNGATLNTSGGEWTMADGQSITGTGATGNIVATTNAGITMNGNNTISNNAGGTLALYRLNVTGVNNTITAGTITAGGAGSGQRGLDLGRSGAGTLTITGGSLITNGSAALGDILGETQNGNSLIINGGSYTANSAGGLNIGFGQASGILTLTSGNATITTIALAPVNAGNARVNLDGGTLTLGTLTVGGGTGAKSFTFNGGTLVASGALSMSGLNSVNVANGGANINTNGNSVTISNNLVRLGGTSTGGLTKTGLGNLTLSGTNFYAGNTTVSGGTLTISNAPDPLNANPGNDASTVTISATGATLDLTYAGTDTVNALFIGATQLAPGIYGAGNIVIPQITGTGTLTVGSSPGGFSSWITGPFANGTVPALQQGPNADFDNDGISNLVEYAIKDQDPTVSKASIGSFNGITLSYDKRLDATGLTYAIQDSTDLGLADAWAEVPAGPSYVNNATTISYALTPGTPAKNFLRLQVLSN